MSLYSICIEASNHLPKSLQMRNQCRCLYIQLDFKRVTNPGIAMSTENNARFFPENYWSIVLTIQVKDDNYRFAVRVDDGRHLQARYLGCVVNPFRNRMLYDR